MSIAIVAAQRTQCSPPGPHPINRIEELRPTTGNLLARLGRHRPWRRRRPCRLQPRRPGIEPIAHHVERCLSGTRTSQPRPAGEIPVICDYGRGGLDSRIGGDVATVARPVRATTDYRLGASRASQRKLSVSKRCSRCGGDLWGGALRQHALCTDQGRTPASHPLLASHPPGLCRGVHRVLQPAPWVASRI